MTQPIVFVLLACAILPCAVSCVATEDNSTLPQIDVSPENWKPEGNSGSNSGSQPISGAIGITVARNESDSLERLEVLPGVRVTDVVPGGPSAIAGLRVGDIILTLNGVATNDRDAFDAALRDVEDGSVTALEVRRDTVAFGTRLVMRRSENPNELQELFRIDPIATRAAFRTAVKENGRVAAEVVRVFAKSPFPDVGIGAGDSIVTMNGAPLSSAQDLVTQLVDNHDPGDKVALGVLRGGEVTSVDVRLWSPGRSVRRVSLPLVFDYQASPEPDKTTVSLLDLWIISLFEYQRHGGEREYRILKLIRFGSGYGELVEETP